MKISAMNFRNMKTENQLTVKRNNNFIVANAKLAKLFICPSLKDLFGLTLFYLGKTHKSIFYREMSCGHFTETPPTEKREYLKSVKNRIFFPNWVGA